MFLIKGTNSLKEMIISILSSVDMEKEALLVLLNKWYSSIKDTDIQTFKTINRLTGKSKDILTDKYELMKWFIKSKFSQSLPCIVFSTYNESVIQPFFDHGTKHKFLKASDGFSGSGNKVVDSVDEVKDFVEAYKPTKEFKGWILQDALETIATFDKYKFHLRVILVVVVHNRKTSIYISNYHTYVLSNQHYDVGRLKEETVYNTHKSRNTQNAFFPMERPDDWTSKDADKAMNQIHHMLRSIFEHHHTFQPDWNIKNGYEVLGVDVLFDTTHQPYILEINQKMALYPSQTIFLPEIFHLGLGGAPLKLFKSLYGISHPARSPFTKPLSTFYRSQYKTVSEVYHAFQSLFHITLEEEGDRAYYLYQKPTHHTRRAKSKVRGSKTLKRGSRR